MYSNIYILYLRKAMLSSQGDTAWTEIKAHLCRTEEKREAPKKITCDFNAIQCMGWSRGDPTSDLSAVVTLPLW